MLHCIHQLVANFFFLLFGAVQAEHSGVFLYDRNSCLHGQKKTPNKQKNLCESSESEPDTRVMDCNAKTVT